MKELGISLSPDGSRYGRVIEIEEALFVKMVMALDAMDRRNDTVANLTKVLFDTYILNRHRVVAGKAQSSKLKAGGPLRIYLAARYSRREELCHYRDELRKMGHDVQARWLDGEHQIDNAGTPIGEDGEAIVEGTLRSGERLSQTEQSARAEALRQRFAKDDYEDVQAADVVISFTEAPRSSANRGGRHVEYGIALAMGKRVMVVGHRENIFHWLPTVEFYTTPNQALLALAPLIAEHGTADLRGFKDQPFTPSSFRSQVSALSPSGVS